jgi:hypothetical protein
MLGEKGTYGEHMGNCMEAERSNWQKMCIDGGVIEGV